MKKTLLSFLLIFIIFIVAACNSTPVGDSVIICWSKDGTVETLIYDVIENNTPIGTLTLKSRSIPALAGSAGYDYEISCVESDGSVAADFINVPSYGTIIECEMTFDAKYIGDSLKYYIALNRSMQPLYSYRELTVDAYIGTLIAEQKEKNTAVSYKTSSKYIPKANGNIDYCEFRTYITGADVPYSTGSIAGTGKYQYDNDELIYLFRALEINGGFSMNYSIFSPMDNSLTNLTSRGSTSKVNDILYFSGSELSTIEISVGLNQSLPGQSNVIHYSSDPVTVKDTTTKLTKVPLKIIQGNFSYVLKDIII